MEGSTDEQGPCLCDLLFLVSGRRVGDSRGVQMPGLHGASCHIRVLQARSHCGSARTSPTEGPAFDRRRRQERNSRAYSCYADRQRGMGIYGLDEMELIAGYRTDPRREVFASRYASSWTPATYSYLHRPPRWPNQGLYGLFTEA